MNLKFNRSLFRDVSRECSLEGKFEAVINRNNPAYLLKLDGKDKTVFSQQVSWITPHRRDSNNNGADCLSFFKYNIL